MCLQFKKATREFFILYAMNGPFEKKKLSKMLFFHLLFQNIIFIPLHFLLFKAKSCELQGSS